MQMPIINDPEFWTIEREPWQDALKRKEASIQFPCDSAVKNPPAIQETWVQSLGYRDPLEEGMATHSITLAWRIPMDRGVWQAAVHRIAVLDMI